MKLIREESCCFTGHRRLSLQEAQAARLGLRAGIARMEAAGVTTFLAGGALGFDTIAAQEVLRAKGTYCPWVHLVLVLPCLGQEARWSARDAAVYRGLLRQADEVIYTADIYFKGCMLQRDRYLVNHSAYCLCFLRDTVQGGTAYTVRYAQRQGLSVVNLAEGLTD